MDSEEIRSTEKDKNNNKLLWTTMQDDKLVESMLELCVAGKMKSDNCFKPGTLTLIEKLMEEKLPGSGIKARPHIESRIKYLKNKYNAISDMLCQSSGFAWDDDKKMMICEKQLYDGWVKSHSTAAGLWMKPFPHYDDLALVFGKDRANGKGSFTPTNFVDDMNQNEVVNNDDEGLEAMNDDVSATQPCRSTSTGVEGSSQSNRKRRKSSDSYMLGFSDMVDAFKQIAHAMKNIANSLDKPEEGGARMDKVFDEVSKILGVDELGVLKAGQIIMNDPVKVNILFTLLENLKKHWVEGLLRSD